MHAKGNFIAQADHGGKATININMPTEKPKFILQRPKLAEHFTNRETELIKLINNLRPGQVVTLCGPGGIGKSALAAKAIHEIFPEDNPPSIFPDGVFKHDFSTEPSAIIALGKIARSFGEELRPTPAEAAQRALSGRKCLVLLDGADEADNLQLVLKQVGNNGVLITSQNIDDAFGDCYDIKVLELNDAVKLLLSWSKIKDEVDNKKNLERICELVGCLPLAICLAGRYIHRKKKTSDEYLKWLETAPLDALDNMKRKGKLESIAVLLKRSLKQVSKDAINILATASILAFETFSKDVVQEAMPGSFIEESIDELLRYGLFDSVKGRFIVSNVMIHTYTRKNYRLDDGIVERVADYYSSYARERAEQGPKGYVLLDMERAHIMCVMEECRVRKIWHRVNDLVIATNDYLQIQGLWKDRLLTLESGVIASQKMGNKQCECSYLGNLGNTYYKLGQVEKALENYKQALAISRKIGLRQDEGIWLGNLGNAYCKFDQLEKAIEYTKKALDISRETGDRQNESIWLGNLGKTFNNLGQVEKAIECYKQALSISREIRDLQSETTHLANLGLTFNNLGKVEKAIEYYEQSLAISRDIGHRQKEVNTLGNLGVTYSDLGRLEKAIGYYKQALAISRDIGDLHSEGANLGRLGITYSDLGQLEKAIEYYKQALVIIKKIGSRKMEVQILGFLGNTHRSLEQVEKAIDYYEEALTITREDRYRQGEGHCLYNLGLAYRDLGQVEKTKLYLQESLFIFEQINSPNFDQVRGALEDLAEETARRGQTLNCELCSNTPVV